MLMVAIQLSARTTLITINVHNIKESEYMYRRDQRHLKAYFQGKKYKTSEEEPVIITVIH